MKNKKLLVITVIIILISIIVFGGIYYLKPNRTYELKLPQLEVLDEIVLQQSEKESKISTEEEIKYILNVIKGTKRITKEESIQDMPVNTDKIIRVDFKFKESGASTIFVYKKNNKYYIEQPYNGIYNISEDEYNMIEKYVYKVN